MRYGCNYKPEGWRKEQGFLGLWAFGVYESSQSWVAVSILHHLGITGEQDLQLLKLRQPCVELKHKVVAQLLNHFRKLMNMAVSRSRNLAARIAADKPIECRGLDLETSRHVVGAIGKSALFKPVLNRRFTTVVAQAQSHLQELIWKAWVDWALSHSRLRRGNERVYGHLVGALDSPAPLKE